MTFNTLSSDVRGARGGPGTRFSLCVTEVAPFDARALVRCLRAFVHVLVAFVQWILDDSDRSLHSGGPTAYLHALLNTARALA